MRWLKLRWVLTCFCDVERQPEEESVADQFSEQQTQRELDHSLQIQTAQVKVISYCYGRFSVEREMMITT